MQNNMGKFYEKWIETMIKDLTCYLKWVQDWNVTPYAIELPLCSDTLQIATLVDFLGNIEFKREEGKKGRVSESAKLGKHNCIVDFKSGKSGTHESHILQLEANLVMIQENFPELSGISQFYNFSPKNWNKDIPTYTFTNQTEKMDSDSFNLYVELGKKKLRRILDRKVLIIDGVIEYGESPTKLIKKMPIHEIISSGLWENFLIKPVAV